jgi:flagellar biosynthetic protein FlhB
MRRGLERAFRLDWGAAEVVAATREQAGRIFLPLAAAGSALVLTGLAVRLATTRMGLSSKKLAPDLKRLHPLARLRELPKQNLPALVEALIMLPLFGLAVWRLARDNYQAFLMLPMTDLESAAARTGRSLLDLFWKAAGLFVVFGVVDLVRQRRRHRHQMRMSKQEIREEFKELEGNPQIKSRIRRLQRDAARRRMMKEVPRATAVVVNPTHYAVALRYEIESMGAPLVVAKGRNWLALRIRSLALEHQVPVIENPPLAQALYNSADVGQEIPVHLYRAVAEVLSYVFRLMQRRRG